MVPVLSRNYLAFVDDLTLKGAKEHVQLLNKQFYERIVCIILIRFLRHRTINNGLFLALSL